MRYYRIHNLKVGGSIPPPLPILAMLIRPLKLFRLGLIPITDTEKAKLPAEKMFFSGKFRVPLGNLTNAIIYYGNSKELIVPPDK